MALLGVAEFLAVRLRAPGVFFGGVMLVGLSLFAFWAASDLPGMPGFAFGPGTAPRLFAYALMIVGFGVMLMGLFLDGPPEEPFAFSGPVGGVLLIVALNPITYYSTRIGRILPVSLPTSSSRRSARPWCCCWRSC